MVKVSVQIVTWNSIRYIDDCLNALSKQTFTDFSVVVIDNGSNDDTVKFIRSNYPTAVLLQNFKNLGFCKANNQGILMTKSQYVLVMNPDVILEEDFLANMVEFADEHVNGGSFAPKSYRLDSQAFDNHNDESGLRQAVKTHIIDSAGLEIYKSRKVVNRGENQIDEGQFNREIEVFGASGNCVLYRRSALEDVMINKEMFDNNFFAYKEDVDLAWRLRLYGWENWYSPHAVCHHHRNFSLPEREMKKVVKHRKNVSKFLRLLSFRNQHLMLAKNEQLSNVLIHLPWILVREVKLFIYSILMEPFQFKAMGQFFKYLGANRLKRQVIMSHAKLSAKDMRKWFI